MSAKTTTILAIAIAALMMLCAVTGAVIYSSNNNNMDDRDVPSVNPVKPVRPDVPVGPIEPKVNYLPDNLDDLNSMLSGSSYSDSDLLVDSLMHRQYRFNGSAYTIMDTQDVAAYLYTLGLNVFGSFLIPDYSAQVPAVENDLMDEKTLDIVASEKDADVFDEEEKDVDEGRLVSGIKKESFTDDMGAPLTAEVYADVAIAATAVETSYDLNGMTIDQFVNTVWFTDRECIFEAFMFFLNILADSDDNILDAMTGTPFIINDEGIIIVSDADDLSLFLYSIGIEIVSNKAIELPAMALGNYRVSAPKAAVQMGGEDLQVQQPKYQAVFLTRAAAATSCSFLDLSTTTVADFCMKNLAMIDSANDSWSKVRYTASFLDMFNSMVMSSYNSDMIADMYDDTDGKFDMTFGTALRGEASVDTKNIAMTALTGTVFTDADGQIRIVKDATTFSSFLDSLGLIIKDDELYCYSLNDSALIKMDIRTMDTFTLFYILTENGYVSFVESLEQLEEIAAKYAAEEAQKQEESTAAEQTESAAMEETSESVEEAAAVPDVEPCNFYDDGTIADQLVSYLEQFSGDNIVMEALIGCYNGDTCMEGEEYVYEFLAFYGFDSYWGNESIDNFLYFVMNEYGGAGYENELDEEGNVVEE